MVLYDGGDGPDDIADDGHDLDDGFSFLSLAEKATIAAWDAVEAEWNEVPRSYAPCRAYFYGSSGRVISNPRYRTGTQRGS